MISNSSIPAIEFVKEKIGQFDFAYNAHIKVNFITFPNIISAVKTQQFRKNLCIQFAENEDELDYFADNLIASYQGSNVDIEELKKISREVLINTYKKDIWILIPKNRDVNPRDSEFSILPAIQISNYLNPHLNSIIPTPDSQLVMINIGSENFKDQEKARFFIDAFSRFSKEYQESIIISAVTNFNFDFIDEFLKYKGDDPEYLLLSAMRKNETAEVLDILKSESSLPSYSLNLFRSTIQSGNLEMTAIILENPREFDIESLFVGAIKAKKNQSEILNLFLPKIRNIDEPIPDINDSNMLPPIILSIKNYNIKITNILLDHGADVNIMAKNETPLITAIKCNNKLVEILLDKGADIDKRPTENGDTPLIFAIRKNKVNIVKLLLDRGAKYDKLDSTGLNSIHIATKEKNLIMVEALVEKNKGSVNSVVSKGEFEKYTPLHFATLNNYAEMVEFLLENNAKTDKTTKKGETALHFAVGNNNTKITQLLLTKEVDKKTLHDSLHIAIEYNNLEIIKLLLEKGANPNAPRPDGLTPIGFAILYKRNDLLNVLLESKKIDFNSPIQSGIYKNYSPIHLASFCGNKMMLEKLLTNGNAKTRELINKSVNNDLYPIHLATQSKSLETMQLLLENGANVDQVTAYGLTSRDIANDSLAEDKIIALLLKAENDRKTKSDRKSNNFPLHFAITHLDISCIEELITNENINQFSPEGFTPLHLACDSSPRDPESDKEDIHLIRILLDKGANINIGAKGNFKNFTALHFAIQSDNISIARFLLEENADINKFSLENNYATHSPLSLAVNANKSTEMISLLLEKGAKITTGPDGASDDFFNNFIFSLINENQTEIARLLLDNLKENQPSFNYSSLIFSAVSSNQPNIVKIILEMEDISIETFNSDEQSLLHIAVSNQSTPILTELLKSEKIDLDVISRGLTPIALAQLIDYEEGEKLLIEEGERRAKLIAPTEISDPINSEGKNVYEEIRKISRSLRDKTGELAISPPSLINLLRENPEEIFLPQNEKNSATIFQFVAAHPECINLLKDILSSIKSSSSIYLINEDRAMAKTKSTEKISIPPLYSAISFGNLEGARSLIEAGAEINFRVTSNQFSLLEVLIKDLKKIEETNASKKITRAESKKVENILAITALISGENEIGAKILFSDEESQKIIKSLDKVPSQKIKILDILQKNYPENEFFQKAQIEETSHGGLSRFEELNLDDKTSSDQEPEVEVVSQGKNPNAIFKVDRRSSRSKTSSLSQAKTRHNS